MRPRRAAAALVILALAAVLAGCGGGGGGDGGRDRGAPVGTQTIRLGAKNFTEQAILGELYRQALEARGYSVVLKDDIGSTEVIHTALRRGSLDVYPEYVSVLLSEIAGIQQRPRSAAAAYELARAFEERSGLTLLAQTRGANSNALGVKPSFARRHRLRTIADLRRLPEPVTIAALSEFKTRFEGVRGLEALYGLHDVEVLTVKDGGRYAPLDRGDVDVTSVFTTDAQLAGGRYTVLADPRRLFAAGHVAPIISQKTLAASGPALRRAIDAVSATLTTSAMRRMNGAVEIDGRTPRAVAAEFLRSQSLV